MKILGISGTLVGSKTSVVIEYLVNQIKKQYPEFEIEMIDLKDFKLEFCDGRPLDKYNDDTKAIISKIDGADGYVLGTTILHCSIPGALKNLLDLVPVQSLEAKPIALVANGGNPEHSQAIEKHLKPIIHYLKMNALPTNVFVTSNDFNQQNHLNNPEIQEQLMVLAKDFGERCNHTVS
ncbi:NADPH-dependent FMN reductase [Mesobacillus maritimus]|uniref:NADPH-dependent FMN reductase n=1 Tax=Mesobacillus maritimus TaxID=1643336 RepID=UPI00384A507E